MKQEALQLFAADLIAKWNECAPYGDQVPKELPRLLADFCAKHGLLNEDGMWDAFMKSAPDDPLCRLFECIFTEAAIFTTRRLADAVFDRDAETLALIDLKPEGDVGFKLKGVGVMGEPTKLDGRCESCAYWAPCPTQVRGCAPERICALSTRMDRGPYGQDGQAIITPADFGCIHWRRAQK
jgi:hypothetical protein